MRIVLAVLVCALAGLPSAFAEAPAPAPGGLELHGRMEPGPVALTADERRARATLIRDAAASVGMTNGVLLAGIAQVETNFAHCWSEATWACQGPPSASCGGGPVIAGAADGPCSAEQGGLGMFQFDSGTFSQTLATYGPDIVTVEGNTGAVVPFLVTRAIQSIDGVNDEAQALAWMNAIPIVDGDPEFERWVYFVSWRYNGCMGCTSQENKYRQGTHELYAELGAEFWAAEPVVCAPVPPAGREIEEVDACFTPGGTFDSWWRDPTGHAGSQRWTYTTAAEVDNFGVWTVAVEQPGSYELAVWTDGGGMAKSTRARYVITYGAAQQAEVLVDQTAGEGWKVLGTFALDAAGASVRLDDNTGEAYDGERTVAFDALRVLPGTGGGEGEGPVGAEGGCAIAPAVGGRGASSSPSGGLGLAAGLGLALVALGARRRR